MTFDSPEAAERQRLTPRAERHTSWLTRIATSASSFAPSRSGSYGSIPTSDSDSPQSQVSVRERLLPRVAMTLTTRPCQLTPSRGQANLPPPSPDSTPTSSPTPLNTSTNCRTDPTPPPDSSAGPTTPPPPPGRPDAKELLEDCKILTKRNQTGVNATIQELYQIAIEDRYLPLGATPKEQRKNLRDLVRKITWNEQQLDDYKQYVTLAVTILGIFLKIVIRERLTPLQQKTFNPLNDVTSLLSCGFPPAMGNSLGFAVKWYFYGLDDEIEFDQEAEEGGGGAEEELELSEDQRRAATERKMWALKTSLIFSRKAMDLHTRILPPLVFL
ncbi:hypothetical protein P7C70_g7517, partial [Phenoliferia sp. Uapishka_3]